MILKLQIVNNQETATAAAVLLSLKKSDMKQKSPFLASSAQQSENDAQLRQLLSFYRLALLITSLLLFNELYHSINKYLLYCSWVLGNCEKEMLSFYSSAAATRRRFMLILSLLLHNLFFLLKYFHNLVIYIHKLKVEKKKGHARSIVMAPWIEKKTTVYVVCLFCALFLVGVVLSHKKKAQKLSWYIKRNIFFQS